MKLSAVLMLASLFGAEALASDVGVDVGLYRSSCGYYSATTGVFSVRYQNEDLPPDARVSLHYGFEFNGQDRATDWQDIADASMTRERGAWTLSLEKQIHYRSSWRPVSNAIDFVFRIEYPNGFVAYDKGGDSALGFYRVAWDTEQIACGTAPQAMIPATVDVVERGF